MPQETWTNWFDNSNAESNIGSWRYDRSNLILEIKFSPNGVLWRYLGVPDHIYELFVAADHKTQFFHRLIKPHYKGERII